MIDMEELLREVSGWTLIGTGEELIAFEDEDGMVHIQTKGGTPRMNMPRKVFDQFKEYEWKEYGVSRSG